MILITSYQRPNALLNLLKELQGETVVVIDDGSTYDATEHHNYCTYHRVKHQGKEGFWKLWQLMLNIAKASNDDEFIFLQDDCYDIDLEGLRSEPVPSYYALNLMDMGPDRGWTPKGYVDCIFKTNRKSLDKIGWQMEYVNPIRWVLHPEMSSGVGQQLSQKFYEHDIPMMMPKQNYASHGDGESKMHPQERQRNPLKAETGQ